MSDTDMLALAMQALRDICNPVAMLRRRDPDVLFDSQQLAGYLGDPAPRVAIAERALRALGEEVA